MAIQNFIWYLTDLEFTDPELQFLFAFTHIHETHTIGVSYPITYLKLNVFFLCSKLPLEDFDVSGEYAFKLKSVWQRVLTDIVLYSDQMELNKQYHNQFVLTQEVLHVNN